MKLKLSLLALVATLFVGCSTTDSGTNSTSEGAPVAGVKHCIRSVTASNAIPGGTKAIRLSDSSVATVDINGCYEFAARTTVTGFAGRAMDATDSVQLYNDSALFAVTLPYVTAGDTVNVVPTIVTLQNAPNSEVDSVHLVVYDKVHILSRKVRLRRSNDGEHSSFSRTLWSRDDGRTVLVHFQINGSRTFASSVYEMEPGAIEIRDWSKVKTGSVPTLTHGFGSFSILGKTMPSIFNPGDTNFVEKDTVYNYVADSSLKIDTVITGDVTSVQFRGKSIYGISSIKYGAETSIDVSSLVGLGKFAVTLTDSAGYTFTDTVRIVRGTSTQPINAAGCASSVSVSVTSTGVSICIQR